MPDYYYYHSDDAYDMYNHAREGVDLATKCPRPILNLRRACMQLARLNV